MYKRQSKAIADFLNNIGATTPAKHKENKGKKHATGFIIKDGKWDAKMINRIIENKVYTGVLEQGKTMKLNYKSKKEIDVHEDDWVAVSYTHLDVYKRQIMGQTWDELGT